MSRTQSALPSVTGAPRSASAGAVSASAVVPLMRRVQRFGIDPTLPRNRFNVPFPICAAPTALEAPHGARDLVAAAAPAAPHTPVEVESVPPADSQPKPSVVRRRFGLAAVGDHDGHEAGAEMGPGDAGGIDENAAPRARFSSARAGEAAAPKLDEMIGTLERVSIVGNWAIGSVLTSERMSKKVTGEVLRDLVEGNEYVFRGRNRSSDRYGDSLEVSSTSPHISPNQEALSRFIWKNFKGIGPVKAERFVRDLLAAATDDEQTTAAVEKLRNTLLYDPWSLDLSSLAKNAQFNGGSDEDGAPTVLFVQRDLAMRLGAIPGMRENVLKDLAKHLVAQTAVDGVRTKGRIDPAITQKCWAALVKDPYEAVQSVSGYGFLLADTIGKSLNIPRDAPARLRALVAHSLNEGCTRSGHVYLSEAQLHQSISALDPRVGVEQALEQAKEAGTIRLCDEFGSNRYYPPGLLDTECSLALRIATMCQPADPLSDLDRSQVQERVRIAARKVLGERGQIDASQMDALVGLMTSDVRIHTLTAGPGCGKTALMEILAEALKGKDFTFMGPTGKSAKVLSNRLRSHGMGASTIHSALRGASAAEFTVNEEEPLGSDVVVVDESSMADLGLADGVLAAVKSSAHLILLGDPDQLPSIAPGNFLRDLLRVKSVDHHRLDTTHRNQGGILELIKQVRGGKIDCVNSEGVTFSRLLGDARAQEGDIVSRYINAVGKHGFHDVALLISKRKGDANEPEWNTTYFNAVLRDLCNPDAQRIPGTKLHVGDRIIVKANMAVARAGQGAKEEERRARQEQDGPNYSWDSDDESAQPDERVVNGDTGIIISFTRDEKNPRNLGARFIQLRLDDGRDIDFPGVATESLAHSYALTVHAGQGSEYKSVIVVATPGTASFINRAMFYTGLSRASQSLHVHGDEATLRRIAATPLPRRNSALFERVMLELGEDMSDVPLEEPPAAHQQPGQRAGRFSFATRQAGG